MSVQAQSLFVVYHPLTKAPCKPLPWDKAMAKAKDAAARYGKSALVKRFVQEEAPKG